jgi:hypothetical protein
MSPNETSSAETQVSRFIGPAIAIAIIWATATTPIMVFWTRLDLVTRSSPLKVHRDRELKHVPSIVLHELSPF